MGWEILARENSLQQTHTVSQQQIYVHSCHHALPPQGSHSIQDEWVPPAVNLLFIKHVMIRVTRTSLWKEFYSPRGAMRGAHGWGDKVKKLHADPEIMFKLSSGRTGKGAVIKMVHERIEIMRCCWWCCIRIWKEGFRLWGAVCKMSHVLKPCSVLVHLALSYGEKSTTIFKCHFFKHLERYSCKDNVWQ